MIVAALNGSDADSDVTTTACHISMGSSSKITLIFVIEIPRKYPIDIELSQMTSKAEETLTQMDKLCRKMKVKPRTVIVQARSMGTAIVAHSREQTADVIIMGVGKIASGSTPAISDDVAYVLENATCKVVTCKSPVTLF